MDTWLKTGRLLSVEKTGLASTNKSSTSSVPAENSTSHYEATPPPQKGTVENEASLTKEYTQINFLKSKKRRYDEEYLSFGFIPIGIDTFPDVRCVVCEKVLSNSSLAPAKLKRHLESNHPNLKGKNLDFFKMKKDISIESATSLTNYVKDENEKNTEASFILGYNIARAGKPHTIAESLIKPSMIEVVSCILGEDAGKKVAAVQCSNNTISDRIHKISHYIEDEIVFRLINCYQFSLQMDESTDVSGLSILLVFARYTHEKTIQEGLLICENLKTHATGEEIFEVVNKYFEKKNISWQKCVDVCTDGAAAMVGKIKGVITRIKEVAPKCSNSHCVLHRHALATKKLSPNFKSALDVAVQCVNFIKSRPLKTRLFKKLCEEMGSDHQNLLLHTEIRWLSRGKVLTRLFELRDEVKIFLKEHTKTNLYEWFHDENWLIRLAYLSDIFSKLNETNLSLQGKETSIFQANDKIKALMGKLDFWVECVQENDFSCFSNLNKLLYENDSSVTPINTEEIKDHLINLKSGLISYFPRINEDSDNLWVQNPFSIQKKPKVLSSIEYESLLEIKSSSKLKIKFESLKIEEFWIDLESDYEKLSIKAITILLPFATSYLCETGFSAYAKTKDKFRNQLNAVPDLRIQLSGITPDLKKIMKKTMERFQSSH